jgi:cysteine desulfurase
MLTKAGIYLDSNAGASLRPQVVATLLSFLAGEKVGKEGGQPTCVLNPSSSHSYGRQAKRLLSTAREQVARSFGSGTDPDQMIFTSSGTEANQLAIRSVLEKSFLSGKKPHWITTKTEHDSVLRMTEWVRARGGEVSYIPVDRNGLYDFSAIEKLWREETVLVSLLWVNNETGVINDLAPMVEWVSRHGAVLHVDAAQAWGKIPLNLSTVGAHLVAFSGPKIGALGGSGVLWVAKAMPNHSTFEPMLLGNQEKARRGGTENVLSAMALGVAAIQLDPKSWAHKVAPLRDRLQSTVCEKLTGVTVHGSAAPRVANTLNLSISGIQGDALVDALDLAGFCVSRGSACSSGISRHSHVLQAMGFSDDMTGSSIRISLPDDVLWSDLEQFSEALVRIVLKQRDLKLKHLASGVNRDTLR